MAEEGMKGGKEREDGKESGRDGGKRGKETISISTPINLKKSSRNIEQPVLYLNIQPFNKGSSSSSSKGRLPKEVSLDKDGSESISGSIN
ncbi:hypothetical protein GOBAR_AA08777 [Gossypium barbadense]|uniref:Uncharacterized protein n=1 Tax=Gossypium barbadense TaxID=3634 RepID=A0A2P5Y8E6_GOSBA|nr:hypothetical protein GOBAR_AA08777 [Gossypium barbadense]